MSKLAGISARECIRALEKIGFYISKQQGSHIISSYAVMILTPKPLFQIIKN